MQSLTRKIIPLPGKFLFCKIIICEIIICEIIICCVLVSACTHGVLATVNRNDTSNSKSKLCGLSPVELEEAGIWWTI